MLGVRLTGHATRIEDMQRTCWQDWLASVSDGYHLLSGAAQRIYLVGISLGGALALTFASGRLIPGCPVAGVAALAAPHHLHASRLNLAMLHVLSPIKPRLPKGLGDWVDHQAESVHICYPEDPTRQIRELNDLLEQMRLGLSQVSAPVLLMYADHDGVITSKDGHSDLIYQELGSEQKEVIRIKQGGHNILCDAGRQEAFQAIARFIHTCEG